MQRKSSLLSPVKYTDICKAASAVTSRNDFAQRDAHVFSQPQLQRHPLGLADSGPHIPSLVTANGIYRRTTGTLETRSLRDSRHKGFRMYCDGTDLKVSSCPTLVSQDVSYSANSSAVSE
jgi:hypothetical protein